MSLQQKTTWMRCLITGINLVFLLTAQACDKGEIEYIRTGNFVYINETGYSIKMDVYNVNDALFKEYNIAKGDSLKITLEDYPGPMVFHYGNTTEESGDSVRVVLDNAKCLAYLRDSNNGVFNIQEYDNYSKELLKQKEYTLYYTFMLEDYDQAAYCK